METLKALLEKHHPGVRPEFEMQYTITCQHQSSLTAAAFLLHLTTPSPTPALHSCLQMTMIEAALCWIYNYSLLDGSKGDCVVLGLLLYYMVLKMWHGHKLDICCGFPLISGTLLLMFPCRPMLASLPPRSL